MIRVLKGIPASPGVAVGPLYVHEDEIPEPSSDPAADPEEELARLDGALAAVAASLGEMEERARTSLGEDSAGIFEAHAMFLDDPEFVDPIRERISLYGMTADRAVAEALEELAAQFAAIEDQYLAARAADIRDLGRQLRRALAGLGAGGLADVDRPSIVVARDLTPSETVTIPPGMVLGFCTSGGSAVSHTAILARSMGVPAVVGLGEFDVTPGGLAVLDGFAGTLTIDPDEDTLADAEERARRHTAALDVARRLALEPAKTLDGRRVEVAANVGKLSDAVAGLEAGAEGIGLLRTEFLFLDRDRLPTEDEQVEAYRAVFRHFQGRPVVVRTLDVGGDKQLPSVPQEQELNPFLGRRGIRLTLAKRDLFRTQLRAILRAGQGRAVHVMFPMVATVAEFIDAKSILFEVASQLDAEGVRRAADVKVGIMVEVPAVAVLADRFAAEVDFFSIGTNDLTQYTLAVDRTNAAVAGMADALDPAVLRLVRMVVDAARIRGTWVGVCGELAGDPVATPVLVGLGVSELSMNPAAIPMVKEAIRRISFERCRDLAERCLNADSPKEVRAILASVSTGL